MELLDKIVEVLGDEKMTLAEYQEILEAGFAEASVGIIPPTADQVLLGDNERSRLKDTRVLVFVGVNEGLIPRHDAGGGILSEYDREELERADAKLSPTARETMYQQKFHLYRNLTKPSERLYLSFAKAGASGEAQNPSYLINEIRKLFPEILVRDIEKEESPQERLEMRRFSKPARPTSASMRLTSSAVFFLSSLRRSGPKATFCATFRCGKSA